jgi:hypothetical protein
MAPLAGRLARLTFCAGEAEPKRPRCRLRVRRRTPGAVRLWRLGCSADQHIGIDGEQARGRQILMRLHVIDPPDDEVTGRGIDVEEVGAGLDLADARDLAQSTLVTAVRGRRWVKARRAAASFATAGRARSCRGASLGDGRQGAQSQSENGQQAQK